MLLKSMASKRNLRITEHYGGNCDGTLMEEEHRAAGQEEEHRAGEEEGRAEQQEGRAGEEEHRAGEEES